MVNELRALMRDATDRPPHDPGDLRVVLGAGRRRVRVRGAVTAGATALAVGAIGLGANAWVSPSPADLAAAGVPRAEGPVVRLGDARPAVEGQDYREVASVTNEDLDSDNGHYVDGVTDDGLILFRDGPRSDQLHPRFALMDPASGAKDWLPGTRGLGQSQVVAVELGVQRLVLLGPDEQSGDGSSMSLVARVYDRASGAWHTVRWPGLPAADGPWGSRVGPDGRLYVRVPATRGEVPEGGWPQGPDGEAEDADAQGDSFELWSASLTDPSDVRDEGLRVGLFGFTDDALVWSDSSNGDAGVLHVRDLATGEETSFDPRLGARCNLLGLDVAGDRIAMSQYCGTYAGGVRDDRVQVVTTDGEPVVTVQDSGVDGGDLVGGGDYLTVVAYTRATGGTYLYDIAAGTLEQLSDSPSSWNVGQGPTPGDQFLWSEGAGTPSGVFDRSGATAHLSEVLR